MTESELKGLSIKQLLDVADKAISVYVSACADPKNKRIAEQRQLDLVIIDKIVAEKRANETPLT